MEKEFNQPVLENTSVQGDDTRHNTVQRDELTGEIRGDSLTERTLILAEQPRQPVNNDGKTDELSLALARSKEPKPVAAEPEKLPGKYALDYSLKGVAIHETHATIPHALARIAALGRLGIVPSTSTNV